MPRIAKKVIKNTAKKNNSQSNKYKENNIRAINDIRKELGKNPLPVRNSKWYDNIESFALQRYSNPELAIKMIASDITPYRAKKLNAANKTTAKSQLTPLVNKTYGRYSLDDAIRANSYEAFESNQFEQFNSVQTELLNQDDLDLYQVRNKMYHNKLKGIRKQK